MPVCANCGYSGTAKYCAECGQPFAVKRITLSSLLHEVVHIFTHLDKGFGYTLKQLLARPGHMQREYLEGHRSKHQKPFSMFFICATLSGLAIYWISKPSLDAAANPFEEKRIEFYSHYFVLLQSVLIPFYSLIFWIPFRNKQFNYAESVLLFIYALSILLLMTIFTNMINLLPGHVETYYIEIPIMVIYMIWTNLNFFNKEAAWKVIIKSAVCLLIAWFTSNFITEQIVRLML
jgi:hypothetical protein